MKSAPAIQAIDALIVELEEQLDALNTARALLGGTTKVTKGPLTKPAARLAAGACDESDEYCDDEIVTKTCDACGASFSVCCVHGGARSAGGRLSAHKRFKCEA